MIITRLAIVDECGDVVVWCDTISEEEAQEIIDTHEEWYYKCFDADMEGYE